jgi:acyl-CoA thioesterase
MSAALIAVRALPDMPPVRSVSLNHRVDIFEAPDPGAWNYLSVSADRAGTGLAMCSGAIFDGTGRRLAAFRQLGLIDPVPGG